MPISIVVPSCNRPDLLARLMSSIAAQTYSNYEVVVVNDGSSDQVGYAAIIDRFSMIMAVRYFRNPRNMGAQFSRNRGVYEARHDWIAFVDDDDEWLPEKLEKQAALLASSPGSVGLVYSWADGVLEDGSVKHRYRSSHRGPVLEALLDACFIPSPTVVIRRSALEKAGSFDESLPSCQDWDMWTRVAAAGFAVDLAEEVLAIHHRHGKPSIGASPRSLQGFCMYYEKHAPLYARARMMRNLSEKYRSLAFQAAGTGDRDLAGLALRKAVAANIWNWKAWVRSLQFVMQRCAS